jgi:selenide,water dikinase
MGLVPVGSHANRNFCAHQVIVQGAPDPILHDLLADAQTSGGLLMGVDEACLGRALELLKARGLTAAVIGRTGVGPAGHITLRF